MKKTLRYLCVLLLGVMILSGFSRKKGNDITDLANTEPSLILSDYNYANLAYDYLETIGKKYPNRSNDKDSDKKAIRKWIIRELKDAGYKKDQITLQTFELPSKFEGQNIILTVPGKNKAKQIIVGAHYDGTGIGDNGSGTALLLAQAVGLQKVTLPYTVIYIFFDQEEVGRFGSREFVQSMSKKEIANTKYMINMDCLAFGDYCNIYGGHQKKEKVTQTEGYELAMSLAEKLGFHDKKSRNLISFFLESYRIIVS